MKKRSKYRIVKTLTCKHEPVWYVEYRKWKDIGGNFLHQKVFKEVLNRHLSILNADALQKKWQKKS